MGPHCLLALEGGWPESTLSMWKPLLSGEESMKSHACAERPGGGPAVTRLVWTGLARIWER